MTDADADKLVARLQAAGDYPLVVNKAGNVCALAPLMFTTAIVSECHLTGYEQRWCYTSYGEAEQALAAWSGADGSEPEGWHRHPQSGRRRPNGDASLEYVNR